MKTSAPCAPLSGVAAMSRWATCGARSSVNETFWLWRTSRFCSCDLNPVSSTTILTGPRGTLMVSGVYPAMPKLLGFDDAPPTSQ